MKKILVLIAALSMAVDMFGQGVTDVTTDVRTAGMADAYTAMYGKGFSIYTNSAAAALSDDDFAVSASYGMWQPKLANMTNFAVGAFYKFSDRYTVGLGFRGLMQPLGNYMDENGIMVSQGATSTKMSVEASFGMHIIKGFAAAVNFHFFYDMLMQDSNGMGFGVDVDLMYSHKYFNVALSAKNLGPDMSYGTGVTQPLPMEFRLGYSGDYEVVDDILDITPAVDANCVMISNQGSAITPVITAGVGAEFEFIDMVSIRGGYRYSAKEAFMPSYATVGLGVEFFGIGIDAAYYIGTGLAGDVLTNSFKVGLSYKF